MRFLVVEDEEALQQIYKMELEHCFDGCHIDIACHGVEGLEYCDRGRYDLIITDGRMPEMGGLEMAKKLRASGILSPMILVTGFTEHMHEATTQNLFSLIKEKPLEFEEFIDEIKELIQKTES